MLKKTIRLHKKRILFYNTKKYSEKFKTEWLRINRFVKPAKISKLTKFVDYEIPMKDLLTELKFRARFYSSV